MAKRIGEVEEETIVIGAVLGGLYLFVAKPLLNLLGDDPADKAAVADLDTLDPADNYFSLQFAPYLAYLQSTWGSTDPTQDFAYWQSIKQNIDNQAYGTSGYNLPSMDTGGWAAKVGVGAEIINSAFSFWNWSTDTTGVQGVFNDIANQVTVTAMDAYLQANYGVDLLSLLKNGSTARLGILQARNGLNDTQLAAIIRHVNSLPQS